MTDKNLANERKVRFEYILCLVIPLYGIIALALERMKNLDMYYRNKPSRRIFQIAIYTAIGLFIWVGSLYILTIKGII